MGGYKGNKGGQAEGKARRKCARNEERKSRVTGRNRKTPEEIASEKLFDGERTAKKLLSKEQAIEARISYKERIIR